MPESKQPLIIETLRFDPVDGFVRLALHIDRAERTAVQLGYKFDRAACLMALGDAVDEDHARCRLTVDPDGKTEVTTGVLAEVILPWRLIIAEERLASDDPWLQVKTTKRAQYDSVRAGLVEPADEALFLNERGELCDGTITNLFVQFEGHLVTPPVTCGLLPGVLRQEMLENGMLEERILHLEDLDEAKDIFVGNSLRGLIPAVMVGR